MDEHDGLAERFEDHRTHLRAVAYRMLGSLSEADDAVQEAWLRLSRSDTSGVENLGGWLTTVVARVCLDMLRSRKSRREEAAGRLLCPNRSISRGRVDPEQEVAARRLGRSRAARRARDAGSRRAARLRAARHVRRALRRDRHRSWGAPRPRPGSSPAARAAGSRERRPTPDADLTRKREVVDAFLAASRSGDFDALLALLDPDVVLRADGAAVRMGASSEVLGAPAVATTFSGVPRAPNWRSWTAPRSRLGAGRTAARRLQLHDRGRQDRRDRPPRRPRAPRPARLGGARRMRGYLRCGRATAMYRSMASRIPDLRE